jgi:prepilin-type N-terminal cleavage/methylation domain-containing protein
LNAERRTSKRGHFRSEFDVGRSTFKRGFTLVELLLVIAIISIVTAVTIPTMVKSIRGNRLRTAARSVVMAGRYARSMALLTQQEWALRFDLNAGKISVGRAGRVARPEPEGGADSGWSDMRTAETPPPEQTVSIVAAGPDEIVRVLDRVSLKSVEIKDFDNYTEGEASVLYWSNGRCVPYKVKIADEQGGAVTVDVDALASATTENE